MSHCKKQESWCLNGVSNYDNNIILQHKTLMHIIIMKMTTYNSDIDSFIHDSAGNNNVDNNNFLWSKWFETNYNKWFETY